MAAPAFLLFLICFCDYYATNFRKGQGEKAKIPQRVSCDIKNANSNPQRRGD
jgi:hypothetical protein